MIFLDTHVALWLYFGEKDLFSSKALHLIEEDEGVFISPLLLLEVKYLSEIQRIALAPEKLEKVLKNEFRIHIDSILADDLIYEALDLNWTRDPFDRLLVAHCIHRDAQLLTKDRVLLEHYAKAIW